MLVGKGANQFATEMNIPTVSRDSLVTQDAIEEFEKYMVFKRSVNENFSLRSE